MKLSGIRRQWMLSNVLVVLGIVLIVVVLVGMFMANYFYTSVRTSMKSMANTSTEFFDNYITSSYSEYYQSAYTFTETFESKDRLELQFINTTGRIIISSYGLTAGTTPNTQDITDAMQNMETSVWMGDDPNTGEHILAVSSPLVYSDDQVIGVMRYVTSLKIADRQIFMVIIIAVLLGAAVMAAVIIPGNRFVKSLVVSIKEITDTAKRIASGSYGVQIEHTYDHEIGDMASIINEMSVNLRQSETMKNDFISSVSHELRTPLTAITGWCETLYYGNLADEVETKRGIRIMLNEARRLTGMVEELLDFTRLETGRFTLTVEQTDVREVLEDTVFTYGELLKRENIELNYDYENDAVMPFVQCDPQRLKQVFLNILDNAAKHGREGRRIDVSICEEPGGERGEVVVRIRDYGPGIPENELAHVKSKFYKGSSKERGSGIGLAVCEEIVTRHNGSLDIENAEGGGTLVTVRLPVSETFKPEPEPEEQAVPGENQENQ